MSRNLKLIVPENFKEFGDKVNNYINDIRKTNENYIVDMDLIRFNDGEGKCNLNESITGKDIYILTDVKNYDITYKMQRGNHCMMPDEHYQDIKRILSAMEGQAKKVTLVMPFLYQSRQDKRSGRESLDCAMSLQELGRYNVSEIVTFDAHNPSVAEAISNNMKFSNGCATGELIFNVLKNENININNLFIVSPDEGAKFRAKFSSDVLGGVNYGYFEKVRDYTRVEEGSNPIVYQKFVGPDDLTGLDILLIDDMISTGESLLTAAEKLKSRGVNRIYLLATFSLFTKGIEKFNEDYKRGIFQKLYTTNLSYVPNEYKILPWMECVDCSENVANIINNLHEGISINEILDGRKETIYKINNLRRY